MQSLSQTESIYIHLPFCKTKCPYCDFASFAGHNTQEQTNYIKALCHEIEFRMPKLRDKIPIKTIFFGGGTPSLHSQEDFQMVFDCLRKYFVFNEAIEITMELNPGTVNVSKLQEFQAVGFNRMSLGIQTFDEELLQKLGRGHSLADSYQAIKMIKDLNLKSWSLDLIYGLPNQSLESWADTIKQALSFEPPHISAYALSIETNTPFGEIYKNSGHPILPTEDLVVEMYQLAHSELQKQGIQRYEISNWAKINHEAKHNLRYWRAQTYFAFGLSAHGYLENQRYKNGRDLKSYLKTFAESEHNTTNNFDFDFCDEVNSIDPAEQEEEIILLQLRLAEGLELNDSLYRHLNKQALEAFIEQGFIKKNNKRIFLSDKAILVSNKIIADLLI